MSTERCKCGKRDLTGLSGNSVTDDSGTWVHYRDHCYPLTSNPLAGFDASDWKNVLDLIGDQKAEIDRLRAALAGAVEIIKTWHSMSRIGLRGDPTLEAVWDIYWRNAPEMKPIREALRPADEGHAHE